MADPMAAVIGLLRRRRWMRRALSALSFGLLLAAVGLLGYPFYTNLYQDRLQRRLGHQLASAKIAEAYRSGTIGAGDALTRLRIDAIDLDVVVVEGTSAGALRAGAG